MSLTEAQIAERHSGLGGSDAAPALGLSPWKTPLELFLDKRERRELVATPSMKWGTLLEPVIRQEYSNVTKRVVRLPTGTIRDPKNKFMLAHVDGITEDGRIFEAKFSRSAEGWGRPGTDEIPHHYALQVQHYLRVTGLKIADVAVLIGGSDFRVYEIAADPGLQDLIVEGEGEFWEKVESGTPPPPDFDTGNAAELIARLYPGTNGQTITAKPTESEFRRVYEFSSNAAKNYERVADGAKAHLLHIMGDAARMIWPEDGVQLTRKRVSRKAYSVEATEYIDTRFAKIKETA